MKKNEGLVFTLPFYILFSIFMIYPIVFSFYLSFNSWDGMSEMQWVGLENYIDLFQDNIFWKSLYNTMFYLVTNVPIMIFLALVIATLLNSKVIKGKGFFRAAIYLPNITSMVAVAFTFQLLFDKNFGLLNFLLEYIGISSVNWLGTPYGARIAVDILMLWRWVGYNTIIMLAGLQSISEEVYEAAIIDGANNIQKFFKITIPLMKPIILFCLIMSTIGTSKIFTEVFILTQGGPNNSTITPVLYLYDSAFRYSKFGYASSIAYIIIFITLIFSILQMKLLKEK